MCTSGASHRGSIVDRWYYNEVRGIVMLALTMDSEQSFEITINFNVFPFQLFLWFY